MPGRCVHPQSQLTWSHLVRCSEIEEKTHKERQERQNAASLKKDEMQQEAAAALEKFHADRKAAAAAKLEANLCALLPPPLRSAPQRSACRSASLQVGCWGM